MWNKSKLSVQRKKFTRANLPNERFSKLAVIRENSSESNLAHNNVQLYWELRTPADIRILDFNF